MTLTAIQIKELIQKKLPDASIEIEDIRGDNNHYHATIKSSAFKGLSKLNQHNAFAVRKNTAHHT